MTVRQLPKVELHRHLELALRRSTLRELAPTVGLSVATEKEFSDRFLILQPMKDLGAVLDKFLDTQKLLNSVEVLERIAFEACEDAYLLDGVRILELRYSPTFICMNHPHLSFEKVQSAILRGVERAEREFPIAVGLICIIQRILPLKEAEYVTDFAIENRATFVGLDLADNEVGFDSRPFAPSFLRAKKAGLKITIHAGEAQGPGAPQTVMDAIEYLGADRIGHGVQIAKDAAAMAFVKDRKVPLELCLTSNVLTQAIASANQHPFRKLTDFGVITTINTDDPTIFNTDLNHECELHQTELGMSVEQIALSFDRAASVSFIPLEKRQKVWPKSLTS